MVVHMKLVIFITGIIALCLTGCKKPESPALVEQAVPSDSVPELSLPIQRTITGKDGRKLAVTIVGRSVKHIKIVRASDQKAFDLAIAKLSEGDQDFVNKLPISVIAVTSAADRQLENRQKEIRKLEEKIRGYQSELASGALTSSQSSMVRGKIKRIQQEIIGLGGDIRLSKPADYEKKGSSGRF